MFALEKMNPSKLQLGGAFRNTIKQIFQTFDIFIVSLCGFHGR